jgi:hypothetical protein
MGSVARAAGARWSSAASFRCRPRRRRSCGASRKGPRPHSGGGGLDDRVVRGAHGAGGRSFARWVEFDRKTSDFMPHRARKPRVGEPRAAPEPMLGAARERSSFLSARGDCAWVWSGPGAGRRRGGTLQESACLHVVHRSVFCEAAHGVKVWRGLSQSRVATLAPGRPCG